MIKVTNLTKLFGKTVAVNDVSFAVPKGVILCLLGPNGSGKTTTLKMLAGLTFPTVGTISIDGCDMQKHPLEAKRSLSYLPQRVQFPDNLSAREILRCFAKLRRLAPESAETALQQAGLAAIARRPVGEFSGGMVQRLGIALVTMPDAPLLLLDEPTASLDPEGVVAFRQFILSQRARGKTVAFSTHLLSEAEKLADIVAIYLGGRLVALKAMEKLRTEVASFPTMEEFYLHYVVGR